jgi:hypothetical protein
MNFNAEEEVSRGEKGEKFSDQASNRGRRNRREWPAGDRWGTGTRWEGEGIVNVHRPRSWRGVCVLVSHFAEPKPVAEPCNADADEMRCEEAKSEVWPAVCVRSRTSQPASQPSTMCRRDRWP